MDIRLAGFNVEKDLLHEIDKDGKITGPEVFSAAYARISRSSKSIDKLRQEARGDIVKARQSNKKIIFGMGHHSVAEHAVFNFDLMDVSRLALEAVEQFRLVSYTEKSQRYVTIGEDWVMPQEMSDGGLAEPYTQLVKGHHLFYQQASTHLYERLCQQHGQPKKKIEKSDLESLAKEDARYVLPLSTSGQVGMTINARNLEHLMRRFHLSPFKEVRLIGSKFYQLVENIAPSLILFPHPSPFETHMCEQALNTLSIQSQSTHSTPYDLHIFELPKEGDATVLTLLVSFTKHIPFTQAAQQVEHMSSSQKKAYFVNLYKEMDFFDSPPRHFEFISISFEAVVSASCYAQLKRHRMASLLASPYSPDMGYTVPEQIKEAGLTDSFTRVCDQSDTFYKTHVATLGCAAQYALTNAHRRRVSMRLNLRDLYHFVRLRADVHAQWEIRELALYLEELVRKELPLTTMLLAGKDRFRPLYDEKITDQP